MENPEIFDIIVALNLVKNQVKDLITRFDTVMNDPKIFPDKHYYDEQTVCTLFGLNYRTMLNLRKKHLIKYESFNRHILYRKSEVDAYLSGRKYRSVNKTLYKSEL
jgi:hypothetical protein